MPVGWNWKNSMSASGKPRRSTAAHPSPVSVWALEVTLYMRPKPPVANSTPFAWKTCSSPVASCQAVLPQEHIEQMELVEEPHLLFDALLIERLQDHVARSIGGVAGPADGCCA